MKIVHICISERYVEGDSYHENILPTKHCEMGHDVTVIASQSYFDGRTKSVLERPTADYINPSGIHVIILPLCRKNILIQRFRKTVEGLYEILAKEAPNVIFVHGIKGPDNSAVVEYIRSHKNVSLYADNHNDYHVTPIKKGLKARINIWINRYNARKLIPYTNKFWGTIPLRVDYMNNVLNIPQGQTDVLIMGGNDSLIIGKDVDEIRARIREKYHIPTDAFLVVTGGAFDKRKSQNLLMEAVQELANKNVWLLAFGEPVKGMEGVFEPFRKVSNIVFTGWLPSDDAYDLFLASDIAVFPGWHSVLWEQAVACALPIVVKKWYGVEHVNYNGNAVLMDLVNTEEIKSVILKFLEKDYFQEKKKLAELAAPYFYMSNIANKAIGL